jgi:hypothetical protein
MMNADERTQLLQNLARGIQRRGLGTPARLVLDVLTPLGVLVGQAALFARPLLPTGTWRSYAAALEDERAWRELRDLMDC